MTTIPPVCWSTIYMQNDALPAGWIEYADSTPGSFLVSICSLSVVWHVLSTGNFCFKCCLKKFVVTYWKKLRPHLFSSVLAIVTKLESTSLLINSLATFAAELPPAPQPWRGWFTCKNPKTTINSYTVCPQNLRSFHSLSIWKNSWSTSSQQSLDVKQSLG